jgi:hypothetical protein
MGSDSSENHEHAARLWRERSSAVANCELRTEEPVPFLRESRTTKFGTDPSVSSG